MAKKSIDLVFQTDPSWAEYIIQDHLDEFIADHANCERKASAMAMSLIVKYPDRPKIIPQLIEIAQEELEHFQQVYQIMQNRGIPLTKDTQDPYIQALLKLLRHGRDDRFIDHLLLSSVIECRGAERFRLISQAISDPELKTFYRDLWASEAKHGTVFVDFALAYFDEDTVYKRLNTLNDGEAEIIKDLPWRPFLH
ncbi:MAG: tRNA-(ms[2]io[6]A)-hydroxylase [Methylococcales bacterium]|jgi:tRNA 2-(methylsulfanyl)-N6-isopentenyladenosine37 hydroxylase|nr:tRNA-(ms[2]io[6]A)-hydroxylase [Methylococcales bacterium]MBT7444289.1 tRNA-(ms[2]io[6]A)-hydroxylase [Methylococcales bacterium]